MTKSLIGTIVFDRTVFDSSFNASSTISLPARSGPGRPQHAVPTVLPALPAAYGYVRTDINLINTTFRKSHCTASPQYQCS